MLGLKLNQVNKRGPRLWDLFLLLFNLSMLCYSVKFWIVFFDEKIDS